MNEECPICKKELDPMDIQDWVCEECGYEDIYIDCDSCGYNNENEVEADHDDCEEWEMEE